MLILPPPHTLLMLPSSQNRMLTFYPHRLLPDLIPNTGGVVYAVLYESNAKLEKALRKAKKYSQRYERLILKMRQADSPNTTSKTGNGKNTQHSIKNFHSALIAELKHILSKIWYQVKNIIGLIPESALVTKHHKEITVFGKESVKHLIRFGLESHTHTHVHKHSLSPTHANTHTLTYTFKVLKIFHSPHLCLNDTVSGIFYS